MNNTEVSDELLVAFLDGELSTAEMDEVRDQVASNPKIQQRIEELSAAWSMLDHLPQPKPSPTLLQSTIGMAVVSAEEEAQQARSAVPAKSPIWWFVGAAALLVATAAGFGAVRFFTPHPDQQLAEDLPIIENLDEYRDAEDIDFLRGLANSELFEPDESNDEL